YDFQTQGLAAQLGTIANVGESAVISGLSGIQDVQPAIWIASGTGIPNNAAIRLVTPPVTMTTTPNTITLSVRSTVTGAGSFACGRSTTPSGIVPDSGPCEARNRRSSGSFTSRA